MIHVLWGPGWTRVSTIDALAPLVKAATCAEPKLADSDRPRVISGFTLRHRPSVAERHAEHTRRFENYPAKRTEPDLEPPRASAG